MKRQMCVSQPTTNCLTLQRQQYFCVIMRPSSLGGAAYCVALCLSVCPSVCPSVHLSVRPSRYCLFYSRTVLRANIQNRKNFCFRLWASVTSVLFGTHRGPHIVRPSRPHKFLFCFKYFFISTSSSFNLSLEPGSWSWSWATKSWFRLEILSLGLVLGLETQNLGLGLGLVDPSLDYITA